MAFPLTEVLFAAWEHDDADDAPRGGGRAPRSRPRRSIPDTDDAVLLARWRDGDGTAYRDAIRKYYSWLRAVARSYVASEVVAEELVDDVFHRSWERRATLAPNTNLAVYLFVAVRHAAVNHRKHESMARRRLQLILPNESPPGMGTTTERTDAAVEHDEIVTTVWNVIAELPERARAILTLRWQQHLDWPEIAEAMNMSLASVQMQHSRALKTLRERLPAYLSGR